MTNSSASEPRLLRHLASGTLWLGSSSGITLVLSVVSQVVLGWLLVENDFGVFAVALGLTAFVEAFKDGGIGHWLIQRPREAFEESLAQSFWTAVGFSIAVALVLAAVAPLAGTLYGDTEITWVVLVIALSMPLSSYWTIASARLTIDLRYRTLAAISVGFALIRTGLAIVLAALGFGPLSFVIPLVVGHAFTTAAGYRATGLKPWHASRFNRAATVSLVRQTRWVMGGTLSTSLAERADYAILGLVVATPTVGLYYFAYQLPYRLAVLFYGQTGRVVVPLLVRLRDDTTRFRDAITRGAGLLGVASAPLFVGLALVTPDIEAVVWRGRWEDAVEPAQILALVFPLEVLYRYAAMTLRALGSFQRWTLVALLQGTGLAVVALGAGLILGDDVFGLAVAIGIYLAASGTAAFLWITAASGGRALGALASFAGPYLTSVLAALLSRAIVGYVDLAPGLVRLLTAGGLYALLLGTAALMFRQRLGDAAAYLRALRGG